MSNLRNIHVTCHYNSLVSVMSLKGPLMGGPHCRLSILRNGNVPCRYFKNFPVDFKIVPCLLSILRKVNVPCHYFLFLSVDFKRVQCHLSNLKKGRVALSNLRVKGHTKGPVTYKCRERETELNSTQLLSFNM